MFNTVFDKNLEDFFYADTCTENIVGYSRNDKKTTSNLWGRNVRLAAFALGACLITGAVTSSKGVLGVSAKDALRAKDLHLSGGSSGRSTKVDERTRQELVRKILKIREDFNLSQEDLANLTGLNKFTISKFERGEHSPDLNSVNKYLKFLELADYLNTKLNNKKYAIRQLFAFESPIFDGMNPVEFAHTVGEEGLNEVIYSFKRQYG